jgi:hypothetical protein
MNPEVVNTVLDETQEYRDSQTYVTAAEITHDIKEAEIQNPDLFSEAARLSDAEEEKEEQNPSIDDKNAIVDGDKTFTVQITLMKNLSNILMVF